MTRQFDASMFENGAIQKGFTDDPYFSMLNEAAQDPEISAQAKGVLATLLSLPPTWVIRKKDLNMHHKNGRDAIIKAFDELIAATYILTIKSPGTKGKFPNTSYQVFKKRQGPEAQKQLQDAADAYFASMKKEAAKDPEPKQENQETAATAAEPEEPKETEKEKIPFKAIIDYLNEKTGKTYKNVPGNQKLIRTIWNQGYSFEDFKTVIDNQVADWTGQTFSSGKPAETYLKPTTLFGHKFDEYLNNTPKQQKKPLFAEPPKETNSIVPGPDGKQYDLSIPEQREKYKEIMGFGKRKEEPQKQVEKVENKPAPIYREYGGIKYNINDPEEKKLADQAFLRSLDEPDEQGAEQ